MAASFGVLKGYKRIADATPLCAIRLSMPAMYYMSGGFVHELYSSFQTRPYTLGSRCGKAAVPRAKSAAPAVLGEAIEMSEPA